MESQIKLLHVWVTIDAKVFGRIVNHCPNLLEPRIAQDKIVSNAHSNTGYQEVRLIATPQFVACVKAKADGNSIRSYRDPTEIARTFAPGYAWRSFLSTKQSQSLLGCGLPFT